jgi:ribosomal protein S18 acetylase RimI-like enzyme
VNIVGLEPNHGTALVDFFHELSQRDLTLIKEDVTNQAAVAEWPNQPGQQWLALDGTAIAGYVAVRPLPQWSDHVGELRLVVHPARRRVGVGRTLARHALAEAIRAGRRKLVVELADDQEHALAMFSSLGFTGEALLRDHIRDRDGEFHDLVMLAHFVEGTWASMDAIGITDELGLGQDVGR